MNAKVLTIIIAVVLLIACAIGAFYHLENYEATYYTKVDNSGVQEVTGSTDFKFEYTLDCYSDSGKKKELSFKTGKQLREGAYLLLDVRSLGVHTWEEVQFDDLPPKVQEKLN